MGELRKLDILGWIKGNTDEWFREIGENFQPQNNREKEINDYYNYAKKNMVDEDIEFINNLPVECSLNCNGINILSVHGTPKSIVEAIDGSVPLEEIKEIIKDVEEEVILCGHSHCSFIGEVEGKKIFNSGSIGNSLDTDNRVIYAGSYSKTIAPGMRVGFLYSKSELAEKAVVCKQVSDVHTAVLSQMIISEYLNKYDIDAQIRKSADLNGKKCELMHKCMDKYFPQSVSRTHPQGGLFLWCDLGGGIDSREFAAKCIEKNVAIVSGAAAMPDTSKITSTFRLNFSMASDENIEVGIKALGDVIKEYGR
jgi:predicted phosphodiesterase